MKKFHRDLREKKRQCAIYENLLKGRPPPPSHSAGEPVTTAHVLAGLGPRGAHGAVPGAGGSLLAEDEDAQTRRSQFVRAGAALDEEKPSEKSRSSSFPRIRREDVDFFYPCEFCDKRFGQTEFLMRHAMRRHPDRVGGARDEQYYRTLQPSMRHKITGEIFPGGVAFVLASPAGTSPPGGVLASGTGGGSKSSATPGIMSAGADHTSAAAGGVSAAGEVGAGVVGATATEEERSSIEERIAQIKAELEAGAEEKIANQVAAVLRRIVGSSEEEEEVDRGRGSTGAGTGAGGSGEQETPSPGGEFGDVISAARRTADEEGADLIRALPARFRQKFGADKMEDKIKEAIQGALVAERGENEVRRKNKCCLRSVSSSMYYKPARSPDVLVF